MRILFELTYFILKDKPQGNRTISRHTSTDKWRKAGLSDPFKCVFSYGF